MKTTIIVSVCLEQDVEITVDHEADEDPCSLTPEDREAAYSAFDHYTAVRRILDAREKETK